MANFTGCSPKTLLNYSRLCLGLDGTSELPPADCYPDRWDPANAAMNLVEVANLTVGILGNLVTLLSVPFAMAHQR